jgi:hypothetical protein
VNTVTNILVPQNAGIFLTSCTTGGLSRRAQLHGASWLVIVRINECYSCVMCVDLMQM